MSSEYVERKASRLTEEGPWVYEYPTENYLIREDFRYSHVPDNEVIDRYLSNQAKAITEDLLNQSLDGILEAVERTRKIPKHVNKSNSFLLAQFLDDAVHLPYQDAAFQFLSQNYVDDYVFYHDFSTGIYFSLQGFTMAQQKQEGNSDSVVTEGIARLHNAVGDEENLIQDTTVYLLAQSEMSEASRLLTQDPTGISLVARYNEQIHAEVYRPDERPFRLKRVHPYLIGEYVAAGSDLALGLYERIYPSIQES